MIEATRIVALAVLLALTAAWIAIGDFRASCNTTVPVTLAGVR